MKDRLNAEDLINKARSGDKASENLFYSSLAVRFLPIIKCELERFPLLQKEIKHPKETGNKICQKAIDEIKILCPINNKRWSLIRAINILHHITDDFIMNTLVDLARTGDKEAENILFLMIRQKLMHWIEKKGWKAPK